MNSPVDGLTIDNCAAQAREHIDNTIFRTAYPADQFAGRGIVTCAGGLKYGVPAYILVRALRHVGCELPIDLWYRGPDEYVPTLDRLMQPYGVTWVDAHTFLPDHPHRRLNGFEMKPYAIQWSRFQEVLFLDSDNVPVIDPTYLFDSPQYAQHGTILWPDYHRLAPDRGAWKIWDLPYRNEPEVESGQVIADKSRCWAPLMLADWYGQRSEFTWKHVYGDKELFHLCWRKLGSFAMPSRGIQTLRNRRGQHRTMCQHDFAGKRVFQHHNTRKWSLSNPWEDVPGFELATEVRGWLDDLRTHWNPGSQTFVTAAEAAAAEQYVGRVYMYTRHTEDGLAVRDARRLELAAGGLIGEGKDRCEKYWCLRDGRLQICTQEGTTIMDLSETPAGGWQGRWLQYERMPVSLLPV